jgi:Ca2+-binding EF-hand superfamily protein
MVRIADEFCHAMKPKQVNLHQYSRRDVLNAFKPFEHPDHRGKVHKGVLVQALTEYGIVENMSKEEAVQLTNCLATGNSCLIDYRALVDKIKPH